nr:hypothetical protein Cry52Nrm1_p036 [Cryptomonas curvata]
MHFSSILSKTVLYNTIFFNSIELNHFFRIYIYFPFCVSAIGIRLKNKSIKEKKKCYSLEKNLYFIIKNEIVFKTNKNYLKKFISYISLLKYNKVENFFIRINNNSSFVISATREKFNAIGQHNLSIIYGIDTFGQEKIMTLPNNLIYSIGYNSIIIGILIIFPYSFLKIIQILKGINFIKDLRINSILLIFRDRNGNLRLFRINYLEFQKNISIVQLGNFPMSQNGSSLLDILVIKNQIFIANSENNSIRTWKITFDLSKKINEIESCGFVNSLNNTIISFLFWGGTFYKFLFTGELDSRVIIWNELLIPILKINNIGALILDSKISIHVSGFILIFKKSYTKTQIQKKDNFNKHLPQTTIKIYSNWSRSKINLNFVLDRLYYLGIIKTSFRFLKHKYILNNIANFLKNSIFSVFLFNFVLNVLDKIKKKEIKLVSLFILYFILKSNFWKIFFFGSNSVSSVIKKDILYQLWKIAKLRKISFSELEADQIFGIKKEKFLFFNTCQICKRISKFKFNKKNQLNNCQFSHSLNNCFFYFSMQYKLNYCSNSKIDSSYEKKLLNDETPKKIVYDSLKNIMNQKEFIWVCKNHIIYNTLS